MLEFGDVWAEVSLDNLKYNLDVIRKTVGPNTDVMAVVKAGAYGHGLTEIAQYLSKHEICSFGVASVSEGIELIKNGITLPIVLLKNIPSKQMELLLENGLIPSISSLSQAKEINNYGKNIKKSFKIHVRVDTGRDGDGIPYEDCPQLLKEIIKMKYIEINGIYTHLSSAYSNDCKALEEQLDSFRSILDFAQINNIKIPIIHAANSPSIFSCPESHFNMVRTGTALYGLSFNKQHRINELKAVMQLKSRVVCIKDFTEGYSLDYGIKYKIAKPVKIATVSIGYADAFFLLGAKNLKVLIKGEYAPIYGNAHMDCIKVDITNIKDVNEGDEVVIFGNSGTKSINAVDIAEASGISVINCESVCFLGERVNFVFIENGEVVKIKGNHQLAKFSHVG